LQIIVNTLIITLSGQVRYIRELFFIKIGRFVLGERLIHVAQRVTITDVAKQAGVSSSTVSHVLSGKRPISVEVCKKVKKVIKELGYRPNQSAQNLVLKKSMQIGVLIDEVENSITGSLVDVISAYLRKAGYGLLLGICGRDISIAKEYTEKFSAGMVDGIINMVSSLSSADICKLCGEVPYVTYMRNTGSPVTFDKLGGALLAMEHLWGLGHRRIGFISSDSNPMDEREVGYRQFLSRHISSIDESLIVRGNDTPDSGFVGAQELYSRRVSAIFSANDMMAVGVLQWAYNKGLQVPQQLSLVGFDDSLVAQAVVPALTTIQMPVRQLAEKTIEGLFLVMQGKPVGQTEVLSAKLMVRNSTCRYKPDE